MKLDTYQKGLGAELIAALYMMGKGYWPLKWRYKTKVGEIDLIMRRGQTLVFIEVKQRGTLDDALSAVTPTMRQRICRAAAFYLARDTKQAMSIQRFDLIAVSGFSVRHLDNAWTSAP